MINMSKKSMYGLIACITLLVLGFVGVFAGKGDSLKREEKTSKTNQMEATVMAIEKDGVTLQDQNHIIYTFSASDIHTSVGSVLQIEYTGALDKNKDLQENEIVGYKEAQSSLDENGIPTAWLDNGIFSNYYILANNKLKTMTLDEKIGQLLLVRYPDTDAKAISALQKYNFGGYLFFERDCL